MGKLSSAIVTRKLATLRDVEEALARQVLYGGDLATNLLEQAPSIDEQALANLLAETSGIAAAPAGELPASAGDARLLVPGDVALRHGLYPLEHAGNTLTIAVSDRLKPEVEQDLAFGLGVSLSQRVAPLVRIRQAISREYGIPLDRRTQRVIAKLEGRTDPSPSMTPPPLTTAPDMASLPRAPTMPPLGMPAPMDMTPLYARLTKPGTPAMSHVLLTAPGEQNATQLPSVTVNAEPPPSFDALDVSVTDDVPESPDSIHERLTSPAPPVAPIQDEPTAPWPSGGTALVEPPATIASGGSGGMADRRSEPPQPQRISTLPPERTSSPPPSRRPGMPAAELGAWSAESKQADRRRGRARHRGPYTATEAEKDLVAAEGRDDVLTAFFDFSCQYFEYAALFAVHGDLAEGRAASGPGADRSVVNGIGVQLDLPGSLATVRNEGRFTIAPLARDGLDARLATDLLRKAGKKVLLLPILVRGRCVLVLYGDEGSSDVELSEIGNIIAFAPLVAAALENVIRKKKAAVRTALGEPPVSLRPMSRRAPLPSREERVEALSSALQGTLRENTNELRGLEHPTVELQGLEVEELSDDAASALIQEAAESSPEDAAERSFPPNAALAAQRALTPAEGIPRQGAPVDVFPLPISEDEITHPPKRMVRRGELASPESVPPDPNPAHAAIAVAPQRPVRRHQSEELRLPSVILNIESDIEALITRLLAGDDTAVSRIVNLGPSAASVLVTRFPGPITGTDRGSPVEPASQRGPVLKALARMGQTAAPFVVVRSGDPDPKVREWATLLLGELPSRETAEAISLRVTDGNPAVRRAALEAGRMLQTNADAATTLREKVLALAEDVAASAETRVAALEALAHVRDTLAVPRIIRLVDKSDEAAPSAQWALSILTRQAFGRDLAAWQAWWQENEARHRIEWLIDALMNDDPEIRRAAGEELKALTKEYFGYYDDLSKGERGKAQKRYREWWESAGKARFSK
jgi:hypothetical protein